MSTLKHFPLACLWWSKQQVICFYLSTHTQKKKMIINMKLLYSTACKCYSVNIRYKKVQSKLRKLQDPGLQSCASVTFSKPITFR